MSAYQSLRALAKRHLPGSIQNRLSPEMPHYREFFRRVFRAQKFNGIDGAYAEFGCCSGTTFGIAYRAAKMYDAGRMFWAFDSFVGLPAPVGDKDRHPMWREGIFNLDRNYFVTVCRKNRIPDAAYKIVEGYYSDTIGNSAARSVDLPDNIAFAYVDCDMYSSTVSVLEYLGSVMKNGMVIAFDDYFCWSKDAVSGERLALREFAARNERFGFLPYIQFGSHGMSFVVEEKHLLGRATPVLADHGVPQ
jgi:hypothetical protein